MLFLTTDSCVIAERFFFVRGCLDIPIIGTDETYTWGVWVSLSEPNFFIWEDHLEVDSRSHIGPFFGWLNTVITVYPDTANLATSVHIRDHGQRPSIVLHDSDHPLAIHQRNGIELDDLAAMMHQIEKNNANPTV